MTSQTPEERIADVEKILGKPFAIWMPEPTVNSTVLYGYPKEHLEQSFHHQLQKHREAWLREEIVRLKKIHQVENVTSGIESEYEYQVRNNRCIGNNQALQTIIDRYQVELEGGLVDKR